MNRHVLTIFCDDIRREVGGKFSFIGVYSGRMFVPEFPMTLPRLGLFIQVVTPVDQPFENLTLTLLRDDEVLAEATVDDMQLTDIMSATEDMAGDADGRALVLQSQFMMSPLTIERPCLLKVRAQIGGAELRGLGLRIEQQSPAAGARGELA